MNSSQTGLQQRLAQPTPQATGTTSSGSSQQQQQQQQAHQLQAAQQRLRDRALARAKLSARKNFSLEDDLEFCPVQSARASQLFPSQQAVRSPYASPARLNGSRMNHTSFFSPQHQQQQPQQQQHGLYSSPGAIRRMENNSSPMYPNSASHHW